MKNILFVIFCLLYFYSNSQDYKIIIEDGYKRYQIGIDKLDAKSKKYPNGWWEICDSIDKNRALYYVNIENNKIHGSFINLTDARCTYGYYYKDSLWTFLTAPEDSTFKMGIWRNYISNINLPEEFYSIKYENDSLRTVYWNYFNGSISSEAHYKKGFGLTELKNIEFITRRITYKEERTKNYTICTTYSGDSIKSMTIVQDSIVINLGEHYANKGNLQHQFSVHYTNRAKPYIILNLDTNLNTQLYLNQIDGTIIRSYEKDKIEVEYGDKTVYFFTKRRKKIRK